MRLRHLSLVSVLFVVCASVSYSQTPATTQDRATPDFKVQVWGFVVADFSTRVLGYLELRSKLEQGVPALKVTDDPNKIRRAERALARRIRVARKGARPGEIFTSSISAAFRQVLLPETNRATCTAILTDNPGEFSYRINGTYPKQEPLSTVPPGILAALPKLPDDVQYRFLGRHLILHDTRANVILDRLAFAIQCPDLND